MLNKLLRLLLSWNGRITRAAFCWSSLSLAVIFLVLFVFLETMVSRTATWVLYPPFWWIAFSLAVKRLHDRGQSVWWLAIVAIPLLGPLWLIFILVFRKGSSGENQYGPDPLEYGDYLIVDIHSQGGVK
jgi:uncharacterized membrane protein YhaH (DUF805 family)